MRLHSPTLKDTKIYLFKKIFRRQKKKKELFREFLRGRGRKVFVAFCRRPKCDKYEEAESYYRIITSERPSERGSEPKPQLRRTVKTPTT
jgi:ssDNA-binding Zn-finger/Zn-ribbon topoisomerase 1